ncbi:hypothetical protein HPB48_021736 [Haemaphysalis longicornis]|uniref:FP protein C-terminal domain-containing protein n=1 Tax=Haemaphysalis longicornis TaxID=44386 RepID=A0A9J6FV81_HAELO|nr:hypothetical protein HPB48_021736 [Haemaphysalis longicornis]
MTKDARDMSKAFEDFKRELRLEIRGLKEKFDGIGELTKQLQEVLKENRDLRSQNMKLTNKLEELEQFQRSNNVEIKGIPLEGEPVALIKQIGVVIQEEVTDADIDICHRVPTARHNESNIIVRFIRRTKRNAFLSKAKKSKLDAKNFGFQSSSTVYVNEHLTRHGKHLLAATVQKKKELGWKFVWTAGGKVFARKEEGSPALKIFNISDIEKMNEEL